MAITHFCRPQLPHHEIPQGLILEPDPFSVDKGTLTPSFKKARQVLFQKYQQQFSEFYISYGGKLSATMDILRGNLLFIISSSYFPLNIILYQVYYKMFLGRLQTTTITLVRRQSR